MSATLATSPATTEQILQDRDRLPAGHPDRIRLRAEAIERNLPLAYRLARRYSGRGEGFDDLAQVAALALVNAVDGYDPQRLVPFAGYATPTILGALKRHFRDTTWGLRIPRSSQELMLAATVAGEALTHEHGRTPTTAELATRLDVDIAAVQAADKASLSYRLPSLNVQAAGVGGVEIGDMIGAADPHYGRVDDRIMIDILIANLPAQDQRILTLRFADDMTQSGIAAEIGVSQMHVSRILTRSLAQLRAGLS